MPVTLGFLLFSGPLGGIFSFSTLVAASQVALGIGASLAGQLLFGPKKPETPKPEDGKYNLRQNVPSLPVVLGMVKKGGDYVFLEETGGNAWHIMVHAGHRINGYVAHYLHDEEATFNASTGVIETPTHFADLPAGGRVVLKSKLGLNAETAYSDVVSSFATIWTNDHRGDGLASILMIVKSVSQEDHQKTFPQGMPVHTTVLEGALLYDPREPGHDPEDDDTWEYAENLALERLWHLTHPSGGKMTFDDMELSDWIAAADICDETVVNKAGAAEPRYHGGFWYRYENDPVEVGRIMDQAAEMVLYETAEGKVGVHAGKYVAPDIRLTENDILSLTFDANRRKNSNVLAVRGRFTDPGKIFNTVDAAIYGDPYTGDNSQRSKTVENVAVQRHNHIQRLQKIAFIRANAPRVQLLCDYEPAKNVPYRRFIKVHYPPKMDEAIVEITGRPKLSLRNLTYEVEGIVIPSTLYDFVAATDEGEPPATVDEIVKGAVPVPAGFDVEIEREAVAGGQLAAFGVGTWTAQADTLILEMEWQPTAGGAVQSSRIKTGDTELRTGYLADGVEYRFRARNWSAGVASAWTSYVIKTAVADTTAPGALSGVSVSGSLGRAIVNATTPYDSTRKVRIWYSADNVLNQTTDTPVVDYVVAPGAALVGLVIGDATRANIALTPDFAADSDWTKGTGWTIAGGVAHHASGTASLLRQIPGSFTAGQVYRSQYTVSNYVSGTVRAYIGSATNIFGAGQTADGTYRDSLTVPAGAGGQFGVQAQTSNFVGDIDNYTVFLETPTCLPQGAGYIFVAAVNGSGIVGPVSGPHAVTII